MRLVWIVFTLVFVSIVGVQESFAFSLYADDHNRGCTEINILEEKYTFEHMKKGDICIWVSGHSDIQLYLRPESSGIVTLEIPRMILDSKNDLCEDQPFRLNLSEVRRYVHGDSNTERHQIEYSEISDNKFRFLTFEVPKFELLKENQYGFNAILYRIVIDVGGNQNGYWQSNCRNQILSEYSPIEQVRYGEYPHNVVCKLGKELVFKNDWSPICVKESSISKLMKKGLIQSKKSPIMFILEKDEFKIGEDIEIIMKNFGQDTIRTPSIPIGFSVYDQNENLVCSWAGPFTAIGDFIPGSNVTQIWNQHYCSSQTVVESGIYELRADHFYEFNLRKMPIHKFQISE